MMPAAKHFDPVLGVDIHIIQPPGPVPPVPIPHPFIGFVIDAFDYVPILGATVMVNGLPRAQAGTQGKAVPSHIPIGGTFIKPPANECEMFMGSATVCVDGDAFSHMVHPALSCHDVGMVTPPRPKKKGKLKTMVLPTSVVLPIPGPPVLVGGPPTISLMAMGMRLGGAALKRLAKTKAARRAMAAFKKARQKVFKNMKPGFLKCKVLRAEPVDITTGEVVVSQTDFENGWPLRLTWTRHYRSGSSHVGACGFGWETPADARLGFQADGSILFHDGTAIPTLFPRLPGEEPVREAVDGAILCRESGGLQVRTKTGEIFHFPGDTQQPHVLVDRITDATGSSIVFMRDDNGLREVRSGVGPTVEVASREGRIERMWLHHPGDPTRRLLVRYEYDRAADLRAVFDRRNHPRLFRYEAHRLVQHTSRSGLSFFYEFGNGATAERVVRAWGDAGLYNYRFDFSPAANEIGCIDSLGHSWLIQLDDRGLPVREIDPLGRITTFEYDAAGRTSAVIEPGDRRTSYSWDDNGNLVNLTRPDGSSIITEYDDASRVVLVRDPEGNEWRSEWDRRGLLVRQTRPGGGVHSFRYDDRGRLESTVDPLGGITRLEYDDVGRPIGIVDPTGAVSRVTLGSLDDVLTWTDTAGRVTRYEYDPNGNVTAVVSPGGRRTDYGYDADDRIALLRDENGHETRFEYFGLSEVATRINPDGSTVAFEYDTEERLVTVTNESGRFYRLHRDAVGRVVTEIDYDGGERTYSYNEAGDLIAHRNPRGEDTTFENDALGRVVAKHLPDGTTLRFSYDRNGGVIETTSPQCNVRRILDPEGRVLSERQGSFHIEYTYDLAGNLAERRSSFGTHLRYRYDAAGRATAVRINDALQVTLGRDALGRVISERLGHRVERRLGYDPESLLSRVDVQIDGRTILVREYAYDAAGNLVRRAENHSDAQEFRYDPCNRIVEHVQASRQLQRFIYDATGSLLREVADVASGGDSANRRLRLGDRTLVFDAAGQVVERVQAGRSEVLEWDALARLRSFTDAEGTRYEYEYDAQGRRVSKATNGETTHYIWDGDMLAIELGPAGPREHIYHPDSFEPLACIQPGTSAVCMYDNDPNGLPSQLLDTTGTVVWAGRPTTFGALEPSTTSSVLNPIRLQGQYHDPESGLHYTRHRYYDPELACFLSPDPLRLSAGENLYQFAPNVWGWIDPLGLSCKASDLPIIRHGTKEWDDAVKAIKKGGKTNFRVSNIHDAKQLLKEGRGNMNRYKRYTNKPYKKGYEVHPNEAHTQNAPHNDLPHLKWKDWHSADAPGIGHIFFGE
jgi:RHS repeat-associated protein